MAPLVSPTGSSFYIGSSQVAKIYLGSSTVYSFSGFDPDVANYIAAVESADGQALETEVKTAINAFILGCKSDGIWSAIKASCIMAGARTLAGALIPLVGTAPTNNNFVAGDYNRTTGLVGDGSTKYLDSNRANNADPQNNQHMSVFINSGNVEGAIIGAGDAVTGATHILPNPAASRMLFRNRNSLNDDVAGQAGATGLVGMTRASSTAFTARCSSSNTNFTRTSQTPASGNVFVFARSATNKTPARLSFYSIGESLDLALLDSRVSRLVNEIAFYLYTGLSGASYDIDTLKYINAGYAAGGTLS